MKEDKLATLIVRNRTNWPIIKENIATEIITVFFSKFP